MSAAGLVRKVLTASDEAVMLARVGQGGTR